MLQFIVASMMTALLALTGGCQQASDPQIVRDGQPSWSPDGSSISFVSNRSGAWQVWVRSVETGQDRQVTSEPAPVGGPSWTPDGLELLYYSGDSLGYAIFGIDTITGRRRTVLDDDDFDYFRPVWSNDGSTLLFDRAVSGNHDVAVMDIRTGVTTPLAPHDAYDSDARWSPGDSLIVFHSDREGNETYDTRIYVMRRDGSDLRRVSPERRTAMYPAWCPDGDWVAFSMDGDLYRVRVSTGETVRMTSMEGTESSPAWSPDGSRIVFAHDLPDGGTALAHMETPFCRR